MMPGNRFVLLVRNVLPPLAEPTRAFVEEVLHSLTTEKNRARLLVEVMAARAGTHLRAVERLSQQSGLPKPKEMLDWLILLYLAFVVESERLTWRAAAGRVGIRIKTLYRMRHRLLPAGGVGSHHNKSLDAVLLALAERCGSSYRNSQQDAQKAVS
jgi:hypothetical protein